MKTAGKRRMFAVLWASVAASGALWANETPVAAARTYDMSVSGFVRQPDFTQITISPSGKYIAALVPNVDKPYENIVAILDGHTGRILNVMHSGHSAMIASYIWVNDNRIVASIATKRGGLDRPVLTGELFAFNADGTDAIDLFGPRAPDFAIRELSRNDHAAPIIPLDNDQLLVSVQAFTKERAGSTTEARYINVLTGDEIDGVKSPVPDATFVADHSGKVRIAWGYVENVGDALWLRVPAYPVAATTARVTPVATYRSLVPYQKLSSHALTPTANTSEWRMINNPLKSHMEIEPVGFNADGSKLYVRVSAGRNPVFIASFDIAANKLKKLYQGTFADPGQMLATADGKDYYAVITQDGQKSLFYFDENGTEAKLNRALAVNFPNQLAYFSSFTRDGKQAIVTVVSDRNPGDYYLFNLDTHNASYLMSAMPWIDPTRTRPMQPIDLSAHDGLSLHGFLTLPAGKKPYPLIVLPHGGPIGIADTWIYNYETQLFASRGYAVLQVNYRGSGGNGLWFQALGFRQWGLSMQDDLTDATHWAITQGYADANRICIYGASYGAYAALEGAVREPDLYKCAIGYDGTYDLRVQAAKSDTEKTDTGAAYLDAALGVDPDDLLRRSPIAGVDNIKADVLLLHGGEDQRTPYESFKEFTKALDHSDKHYESLVERHEGHGFFLPEHKLEAYSKMLDFLDRHIGSSTMSANGTAETNSKAINSH